MGLYFAAAGGATVVGMVAVLVGLGANAASALLGRHVDRQARTNRAVVTAPSMAIGTAVLAVVGLAVEGFPAVSPRAWLITARLAVANTAVAFTLWNLWLRRLSAVESSGIDNTMLMQIAVSARVFLDEPLGPAELGGVLLVFAGGFLTQAPFGGARERRRAHAEASARRDGAAGALPIEVDSAERRSPAHTVITTLPRVWPAST